MKTVVHDCTTACLGKSWFLVYVVMEYAKLYPTIQVVRQILVQAPSLVLQDSKH